MKDWQRSFVEGYLIIWKPWQQIGTGYLNLWELWLDVRNSYPFACLYIYIRTMVMRLKNRIWWGFGATISNTHSTLPKNLWWQIDHVSSHVSGIKVEYLDEKRPEQNQCTPLHWMSVMTQLWMNLTSTELTSGFHLGNSFCKEAAGHIYI
jgi:hypothetical protein